MLCEDWKLSDWQCCLWLLNFQVGHFSCLKSQWTLLKTKNFESIEMPNYKYLIVDPVKTLSVYNLELIFNFQWPKDLSFLY